MKLIDFGGKAMVYGFRLDLCRRAGISKILYDSCLTVLKEGAVLTVLFRQLGVLVTRPFADCVPPTHAPEQSFQRVFVPTAYFLDRLLS